MAERHYTVEVHDDGDGWLWGEVQELPGCFASGRDVTELRDALAEAIGLVLANDPGAATARKMTPLVEDLLIDA